MSNEEKTLDAIAIVLTKASKLDKSRWSHKKRKLSCKWDSAT